MTFAVRFQSNEHVLIFFYKSFFLIIDAYKAYEKCCIVLGSVSSLAMMFFLIGHCLIRWLLPTSIVSNSNIFPLGAEIVSLMAEYPH